MKQSARLEQSSLSLTVKTALIDVFQKMFDRMQRQFLSPAGIFLHAYGWFVSYTVKKPKDFSLGFYDDTFDACEIHSKINGIDLPAIALQFAPDGE